MVPEVFELINQALAGLQVKHKQQEKNVRGLGLEARRKNNWKFELLCHSKFLIL